MEKIWDKQSNDIQYKLDRGLVVVVSEPKSGNFKVVVDGLHYTDIEAIIKALNK